MATAIQKIDVLIRDHPASKDHKQVIVTDRRGYSYSCSWAEPFPSEDAVRQAWLNDRKAFMPHYS
jgi:hypothetical protein